MGANESRRPRAEELSRDLGSAASPPWPADQHDACKSHDDAENGILLVSRHERSVHGAEALPDPNRADGTQDHADDAPNPHGSSDLDSCLAFNGDATWKAAVLADYSGPMSDGGLPDGAHLAEGAARSSQRPSRTASATIRAWPSGSA